MRLLIYGAKLVEAREKPRITHTAECHIRSPEYLQSKITITLSMSDTEMLTVNLITPLGIPASSAGLSVLLEFAPRLAALPPGTRGAFLARVAPVTCAGTAWALASRPASVQWAAHGDHLLTAVLRVLLSRRPAVRSKPASGYYSYSGNRL